MLIELCDALEQCRFADVWEYLATDTDVLKAKVSVPRPNLPAPHLDKQ